MKTALKVSAVLTWINLILWSLIVLLIVLLALFSANFGFLIPAFFLSIIVLHSYAALQLHKSMRNPAIPLNRQTPTGIRFVGFVALLFGFSYLTEGFSMMGHPGEVLKFVREQMPEQGKVLQESTIRGLGCFAFLIGLSICLNIFLNFRLLRWYQFLRDNSGDGKN